MRDEDCSTDVAAVSGMMPSGLFFDG
eukprot:COSAG01_NODE_24973_length_760_cov_0.652042_2_plen_25_part_01